LLPIHLISNNLCLAGLSAGQDFRFGHHVVHGEAELLHQQRAWGGSAEAVDGDGVALKAGVFVPAEAAGGFHHQALAASGGQNAVAVGGVLLFEQLHAGYGDNTHVFAFGT